ncbi:MAG: phosphate ABC transporter ATP-binding protein [Candidatus Omnitrophica bacterium]|nr:phosphate ABC transporter ATP-binding protein [Candidatus Omnitrophota bacterium]
MTKEAIKNHIRARALSVRYGSTRVLNNISIDIPDKKITAIIGPSGCGKTTLLKSFNRLIDLQEGVSVSGQVFVDDEDIYNPKTEITHLRRRMGLLSQRPQVLPMSIYENVVYGLRVHGEKDKKELDKAAERYLREAHLWHEVKDRLHSSAARLSIGQQQRLCLARGLAVGPEVILGDEPTSALDPISAEQIEQRFLALKDKYTIVLVTHILRQARRLADYVVFLYLGNLIEHGPAEEVLNNPKYAKTKAYLEGKFIEEPEINKELDLRKLTLVESLKALERLLTEFKVGQAGRIIVEEKHLSGLISSPLLAQHTILEVKKRDALTSEVIMQKNEGGYSI